MREAIELTIELLNSGELRVADKLNGAWHTQEWLKKAILLYFRINHSEVMHQHYFDKVPLKFTLANAESLKNSGIRLVPPATVRMGAYVGPNTIVMPSFINIGAYVDSGCMIDTWATVVLVRKSAKTCIYQAARHRRRIRTGASSSYYY